MSGAATVKPHVALFAIQAGPSISTAQMQAILQELAAQHERLATDAAFLSAQASRIQSVGNHLHQLVLGPKAALEAAVRPRGSLKVLQSLARVIAAALKQFPSLLGRDAAVMTLVALVFINFANVFMSLSKTSETYTTPDDVAAFQTLQDAGVLTAYTAAARAATKYLTAQLEQGARIQAPAIDAESGYPIALSDDQMSSRACTCVLALWRSAAALRSSLDLMQPSCPLASTATATASLAMALARSCARAGVYGRSVWQDVLEVAMLLARAAVPAPGFDSEPDAAIVTDDSVMELLLLGLAAGTEVLHDSYGGISKQRLLPSLRTVTAADGSVGSGRVAVPPHHEELLDALLGVRSLLDVFLPQTATRLLGDTVNQQHGMSLLPLACDVALRTRVQRADLAGGALQQQQRPLGALLLPLQLVWAEVLALAPPYFADSARLPNLGPLLLTAVNLQLLISSAQRLPQGLPGVQELAPLCRDTLWLVLAPVLLSLCRRHAGATDEDEAHTGRNTSGPMSPDESPFRSSTPQRVFAVCTHVLLLACTIVQAPEPTNPRLVLMQQAFNLLAGYFLDQPLQASLLTEAVLLLGLLDVVSYLAPLARHNMLNELAIAASGLAAEAAARAYATAPTPGTAAAQHQRRLVQQLFQQVVAGLKHMHAPVPEIPAAAVSVSEPFYRTTTQVCLSVLRCALRVLGDASAAGDAVEPRPSAAHACALAARMPPEAQLLWLHLIGRCFASAGGPRMLTELPAQVPLVMTLAQQLRAQPGRFTTANMIAAGYFVDTLAQFLRWFVPALAKVASMLQPGGPAATAVEAGSAAAAATAADLTRLQRQAREVQALLEPLLVVLLPGSSFSADGCSCSIVKDSELKMTQLAKPLQSCDLTSLLQQLAAFGSALVGAFPAPGSVCGNGACASLGASLERFNGGATSACSACKTVKFCSRQCAKAAWRQSHKGPCAVLAGRQQRAKAVAVAAAAAAATEAPAGTSAAAAAAAAAAAREEDSAPQEAAAAKY